MSELTIEVEGRPVNIEIIPPLLEEAPLLESRLPDAPEGNEQLYTLGELQQLAVEMLTFCTSYPADFYRQLPAEKVLELAEEVSEVIEEELAKQEVRQTVIGEEMGVYNPDEDSEWQEFKAGHDGSPSIQEMYDFIAGDENDGGEGF